MLEKYILRLSPQRIYQDKNFEFKIIVETRGSNRGYMRCGKFWTVILVESL